MENKNRREKVAQFWNNRAPVIGSMNLLTSPDETDAIERPEILSYLPDWEGKIVLDLAAGIGRFTAPFAQKAKKVVAVDLCPHFLEENQRRNQSMQNIEYISSDAIDLSFKRHSFDLIFISWLCIYLEDEELETLSCDLTDWLKPGGHLFLRESCAPTRTINPNPSYYAIYRSLPEYPRLFEGKLSLLKEGNIQAYERLYADPFKWYWLFVKH